MRVRSAAFWDYAAALLALAGAPRPASDLLAARIEAQEARVGQATTYEWANLFSHHRAITGAGVQRVNPDRLIEVCTWLRGADLGFPRVAATAMEPRDLSEHLAAQGIPHAFGAVTAANVWSFYEPAPSIQLYVPPAAAAAARKAIDDPGQRTRVEVYGQAPSNLVIAGRDLQRLAADCSAGYGIPYREADVARRSGAPVPVTSRLLTLLDCRVHPEGASHAAFLREQMLGRGAP